MRIESIISINLNCNQNNQEREKQKQQKENEKNSKKDLTKKSFDVILNIELRKER